MQNNMVLAAPIENALQETTHRQTQTNQITNPTSLQNSEPQTHWNAVRIIKLISYVAIMGMVLLGFASSMGWVPWLDAVLASVAGGIGIASAASYSIAKNWGVYNGDGKQKGNIQILKEVDDFTHDIKNIKSESGRGYIIANNIFNGLAILSALPNIGLNIPSKADTEHKGV